MPFAADYSNMRVNLEFTMGRTGISSVLSGILVSEGDKVLSTFRCGVSVEILSETVKYSVGVRDGSRVFGEVVGVINPSSGRTMRLTYGCIMVKLLDHRKDKHVHRKIGISKLKSV
jgi:hypothetical protein